MIFSTSLYLSPTPLLVRSMRLLIFTLATGTPRNPASHNKTKGLTTGSGGIPITGTDATVLLVVGRVGRVLDHLTIVLKLGIPYPEYSGSPGVSPPLKIEQSLIGRIPLPYSRVGRRRFSRDDRAETWWHAMIQSGGAQ